MLAIIKEAYGDDYKMSAARAKSIAKIAKSLKGNKGGSGKGSAAKYDEDYNSILDDVFNNEENLRKHVVEKPEGFKVSVMELYYDDTDTVLMVIKKIKNSSGDVEKVSPITIAPSLHEKIRKLLNVTNAQLEYILKDYFDTSSVVKFKPDERLEHYLSPEEKEERLQHHNRRREEQERKAKEDAELKKQEEKEAEKKQYYKEDVIQAIDKILKNFNLKEYESDEFNEKIRRRIPIKIYASSDNKVIYSIQNVNNEISLKVNDEVVKNIENMFYDKRYPYRTVINNFKFILNADTAEEMYRFEVKNLQYDIDEIIKNKGGQLQEEINKIKNMFKIL